MQHFHVDDHVRVTREIPEYSLHQGDSGVVRSVWCAPDDFCEIEFPRQEPDSPTRCLVSALFVEIEQEHSVGNKPA